MEWLFWETLVGLIDLHVSTIKRVESTTIIWILRGLWPCNLVIIRKQPIDWMNVQTVIAYCWNNRCRVWLVFTLFTWTNWWLRLTRCIDALVIPSYWKYCNSYYWISLWYAHGEIVFRDVSRQWTFIVDAKLSTWNWLSMRW
jgi:hypothetical protein